jgi:hypothetical protein
VKKLVLLAGLLYALPAVAQTAPPAKPKCSEGGDSSGSQKGGTKYEVVIGADGKKIYRIKTGFVICGKVPKPDVLYGLLNSNINYEWENLKQDFLPKILQSVEENPF